jgi:chromosome segregation ATPase
MTEETLNTLISLGATFVGVVGTFFGTKWYEKKKSGAEIAQLEAKNDLLQREYSSKVLTANSELFDRVNKLQELTSKQNATIFQLKNEVGNLRLEIADVKVSNQRLTVDNERLHKENKDMAKLLESYKTRLDEFDKKYKEVLEENQQLKLKLKER